MASEVLIPDALISNNGWSWYGTDAVSAVADAFGGTSTYISLQGDPGSIVYGFPGPQGGGPIGRIDIQVESRYQNSPNDLEADLWIAGAWQGVKAISMSMSSSWQVYTFGGWSGAWSPQQVAASQVKLMGSALGKHDDLDVATLRQVVSFQCAPGRMLLLGAG